MRITYTIEINAAPERVFHCIDHPERVVEWIGHLVEYNRLNENGDRVGMAVHQVWEDDGVRTDINGHITAYAPDTKLGIHLAGKGFEVDVHYQLESRGDGTRLTQTTHIRYSGIFLKPISIVGVYFFKKSYLTEQKKNFVRLAKLCEAERVDS